MLGSGTLREFDASAWRRKELAAEKYKKLHEGVDGEGKSTKHSVAVEKWRQLGIDLGMIDPDAPPPKPKTSPKPTPPPSPKPTPPPSPVRPTAAHSHRPDPVPAFHSVVPVVSDHPLPAFGARGRAAMSAWEGPHEEHGSGAIKVVKKKPDMNNSS